MPHMWRVRVRYGALPSPSVQRWRPAEHLLDLDEDPFERVSRLEDERLARLEAQLTARGSAQPDSVAAEPVADSLGDAPVERSRTGEARKVRRRAAPWIELKAEKPRLASDGLKG